MPISTSQVFHFQVALGLSFKQKIPLMDEFLFSASHQEVN